MKAQFDDRHFDVWREQICNSLLRIDTRRPAGARFAVGIDVTLLDGPLLLKADNRAPGLEFILSKQRISRGALQPPALRALVAGVVPVAAAVFKRNVVRETGPALRELMRARADAFINAHLHEPDLSPRTIAARLGCSTRFLHLVFEDGDASLGATVLARRLDRCRERLTDPRERQRSISEIAFAAGFNDAAHFSRTFKARFGTTARELRETWLSHPVSR